MRIVRRGASGTAASHSGAGRCSTKYAVTRALVRHESINATRRSAGRFILVAGRGRQADCVRRTRVALGEELRQKALALANSLDLNGDRVQCLRDLLRIELSEPSLQFLPCHHVCAGGDSLPQRKTLRPEP